MDILHFFDIFGDKKGLLKKNEILDELNNASGAFAQALKKSLNIRI